MTGSIRQQQLKIKQQMRADIEQTQSLANQLTGKEDIGTAKLRNAKKLDAKTPTKPIAADTKKIEKFLDFMETNYKESLIKVELKRKI